MIAARFLYFVCVWGISSKDVTCWISSTAGTVVYISS